MCVFVCVESTHKKCNLLHVHLQEFDYIAEKQFYKF